MSRSARAGIHSVYYNDCARNTSCLKQAGARALSKIQNSEELIARCLWNLEALRVAVQNQALCQRRSFRRDSSERSKAISCLDLRGAPLAGRFAGGRALLGNALIEMTP